MTEQEALILLSEHFPGMTVGERKPDNDQDDDQGEGHGR